MLNALNDGLLMPARDNRARVHFLLHKAFENIVQHLVRGERILILLVFPQLRRRRFDENILRDHLAIRPLRTFRLPGVAQGRDAEHLHLVEILDRVVAAIHIAIECGIADGHLALVAGCHHHRPELVRDRHQDRPARAGLDVLLGHVTAEPRKNRLEARFQPFHCRGDRQHVIAHAERFCAGLRVGEAVFRGIAVGQHDRVDPLRAERVGGNGRAECGINTARHAEHDALEAVLLDIIPKAEHAGAIIRLQPFLDQPFLARLDPPLASRARERDEAQLLAEGRHLEGEARIGIETEGRTIKDQFILPADLVQIDERQAAFGHTRHSDIEAGIALVTLVGRAIRHQEDFRAGLSETFDDFRSPDILADRQTDAEAAQHHRPRQRALIEDTLFIENAIIRQIDLEAHADVLPAIERGESVKEFALLAPWQADQHRRATICRLTRELVQRLAAGFFQRRFRHEILRRIAGQEQFGKQHDRRALPGRFGARLPRLVEIAGNIPHRRVQLRKSEDEAIRHRRFRRLKACSGFRPLRAREPVYTHNENNLSSARRTSQFRSGCNECA